MLDIHFANRFETLTELFVARIGARSGSVFDTDEVIVPTASVQRSLTLALARRHGICANLRFAYLARWLWQQIGRVVPGVPADSPFDASVLAWRIDAAFGDRSWVDPHPRLAAYLDSADALMRFELASRIAAVFDQYITYRADWLAAWSRGEAVALGEPSADAGWQAALWRRLTASPGLDRGDPVAAFVDALAAGDSCGLLPAVVHVFCLPAIAPLHLGLLQSLGRRIDVELYALNPCREFWFDVVDRRRFSTLAARDRVDHHDVGNPLLAAWGRQAQSQLGALVDAGGDAATDDACFTAHPGSHLLARLHNAILDLAELAPGPVQCDDRSIEVHVCHSPTREIEVLHDRLLALFAQRDAPAPGEVLVVTPDLDTAAPLIDALFGTAEAERFIPYAITGRPRSRVNPAARVLLDLLALAASRLPASAVFGLLQQPGVARRFGLDAEALEQIRGWLHDAGVHWAIDAAQRGELGLPAVARHSLADGLDRLLLGYALPSRVAAPFGGWLPAGDAEGTGALALGALSAFVDALAALRQKLSTPQPALSWPGLLDSALAEFFSALDSELEDLREVQQALAELGERLRRADATQALPVEVVRSAIAEQLDDRASGGVPTGKVTFASMGSLRNIPYRIVCAIGLNDGAFPTRDRTAEFDLMALAPRPGDRQRRIDDRNLFLDLLLAARDALVLSHVGRSVRDNSPLPPSVLVAELLDTLAPAIAEPPGDAAALTRARARLVVEHPLQPFSEAAFRVDGDIRQRSFHRGYADALARGPALPAAVAAPAPDDDDDDDDEAGIDAAAPFIAAPLPDPGPLWRVVTLDSLIRFFRNPCRYLLERRLGIALRHDDVQLQDDEPLVPDWPGRKALVARLLPSLLAGAELQAVRELAIAGTEMPAGAFGRVRLERELAALQAFAERIAEPMRSPTMPPHAVTVELVVDGEPWRIDAGFADLRRSGLLRYRYDELRAGDCVSAWLHHLLLCAGPPPGVEPVTTWHASDRQIRFARCADPRAVLQTLLGLYRRGLREPLAFFPKAAWAYVERGDNLSAAIQVWRPTRYRPFAEGADAAYRLALRGRPDPLGPGLAEFAACAHAVFDPLLAGLE